MDKSMLKQLYSEVIETADSSSVAEDLKEDSNN